MGSPSQFSFSGFSKVHPTEVVVGRPEEANTFTRQTSIYSLTFDEFQNTWGGQGKDFGSMNMDELQKSVWSAEELLATMSNSGNGGNGSIQSAINIQRQGYLTLPRTLSQKTVKDVLQDLLKDSSEKDDFNKGKFNAPQRQPTLGKIPLEEFLFRAGVGREDPQPIGRPSNELMVDFPSVNSDSGLGFSFQPQSQSSSLLGLETKRVIVPTGSPANHLSPGMSSRSSVGRRGRKINGTLEKVGERRERRMLKNRESAARSRARKQAYTLELEAEVAKLKELNRCLQEKQDELLNLQKNQMMEEVNRQGEAGKIIGLRRTLTGPW